MLYEYQCMSCAQRIEAYRKLADRADTPICPACGGSTEQRIFTPAPAVIAPPLNYWCVATGQPVDTWRKRKRIMDEKGLCDAREFGEPNWEEMAEKREKDLASADDGNLPAELKKVIRERKLDVMPERIGL